MVFKSTYRFLGVAFIASVLTIAGCSKGGSSSGTELSKASKTEICHFDDATAIWQKIEVNNKAVAQHLANHHQGDVYDGLASEDWFDDDCQPITEYTLRFSDAVDCREEVTGSYGCPDGVSEPATLTIDVVVDNGKTKINNIWEYGHAKSITFRVDTGTSWSATVNPQLGTPGDGSPGSIVGSFKSDASGELTDAPGLTTGNYGWHQTASNIGAGQTDSKGKVIASWWIFWSCDNILVYESGSSGALDAFCTPTELDKDLSKWSIL